MYIQRHKAILIGSVILLFLLLRSIGGQPSYAQTPEPVALPTEVAGTPLPLPRATATPLKQSLPGEVTSTLTPPPLPQATAIPEQTPPGITKVTFAQLGQPTFELRSAVDQQLLTFEVPYRWAITGDESYIEVHYDLQYETFDITSSTGIGVVDVVVNVYFDDILIATFTPVEGSNQVARVPIPPEAVSDPSQNEHEISFTYFSGNCKENQDRSLLVIHDHSFIHFKYQLLPLQINLADFPRPLAQNLFTPESILIIIPDQYSDADLAAAASVAAAMGQRTFGHVIPDLITAAEATPERLANTSAIIIGRPDANAFLSNLYQRHRLPTTLVTGDSLIAGPANQPLSPDDGVLQEILSDFGNNHVYLIVTGATDVAVSRAARALSVITPRYGFDGDLVIIADFYETVSEAIQPTDTFNLADFGFTDTTFYGINSHKASVNFFIPANWRMGDNPTLTLSYIHAATLQSNSSGFTVKLNNNPVGSAPIDETILGERQVLIKLPTADLKLGTYNRLDFEVTIDMELPECTLPELDLAWLRINQTSQLHLPHTETEEMDASASLKNPLAPFASHQDLSNVWFSLPETPTQAELVGMVWVASWLGNLSGGPGFAPQVSRGAIDDTSQLIPYHMIAFGRPTNNPIIAMLNEQLPQPFVPGEDTLRQQAGNVVYRLPYSFSTGLLQALPAPWNPRNAVLVVTGTTPEGVAWAINTLTDDKIYYELQDDVAFIRADRFETFNSAKFIHSPLPAAVEAITEAGEEVALEIVATVPAQSTTLPQTASDSATFMPITSEPTALALTTPEPTPLALTASEPITSETKSESAVDLPEHYLPQDTSLSTAVIGLIIGLIGVGLVIGVVGITFKSRQKIWDYLLAWLQRFKKSK